jgi:DNA-binding MarR family transcriptional regulator
MSTEPITQALERYEQAGAYHRAARARQVGVPQIELAALEHLDAIGGLTPGELGHRLGLTSGGVTALTGRLIEAGYVARDLHPGDGRTRLLTITLEGSERLHEHMAPVKEPVDEGLAGVPADEAEVVVRVLSALAELREEAAAATPGPERIYPADGYTRALLM